MATFPPLNPRIPLSLALSSAFCLGHNHLAACRALFRINSAQVRFFARDTGETGGKTENTRGTRERSGREGAQAGDAVVRLPPFTVGIYSRAKQIAR